VEALQASGAPIVRRDRAPANGALLLAVQWLAAQLAGSRFNICEISVRLEGVPALNRLLYQTATYAVTRCSFYVRFTIEGDMNRVP
jgi:hypothetical protein